MQKRQKTGLFLVLLPFILFVVIMVLQIVTRFMLSGNLEPNVFKNIVNIISVLAGMVLMIGFLPSIIVGIIFLATPQKDANTNQPPTPPQAH